MNSKLTVGQLMGLSAALLVLLCFFFPWVELNLFLVRASISGFQLATGSGPAGMKLVGVPSLLLVPLSMVGVLILVLACFFASGSTKTVAGLFAVAGGVSAVVILYHYFTLNQEFNSNPLAMVAQNLFSYSFGAHASLFGSVMVVGGGLFDLARPPKAKTSDPQYRSE